MKTTNPVSNSIFLISILIFLLSCGGKHKINSNVASHKNFAVEDILGAWGDDALTGNADFGVYHDSIYYPDPNLWYKYNLKNDTIFLFRENNVIEKILIKNITQDSMTLVYLDYNIEGSYRRRH